jgi:outer membrane protein with beta-barrel domain
MHARTFIVTTLLAAALGATTAIASPTWGPRIGVNASAFAGEFGDAVKPDFRYFPNLGLALQIDLARNVAFRGEVSYSVKGGGAESITVDTGGNTTGSTKDTWRFDYVEVPLLLRTRLPVVTAVKPYLELGPAFGVALSGEFRSEGAGIPNTDLRDSMNALDVSLGGGFGLELPAGATKASLEVRYMRGLADVFKDTGLTLNNQAWTLAVTWLR